MKKLPNMNTAHPYLHCGWCRNKVNKVSSVHQHKHPKSRPSQCSNKPPKRLEFMRNTKFDTESSILP